eukprot:TRINITY_DN5331_c0_g1_i1.p1 TRINITY_DN5331_c0_g1~~TRINITY_DN5331_c0_g1_i1.p1  ORF type:complete len:249 (+),score=51.50 TRINITY_DN5331_c0_g1_i1:78-824(+)
MPFDIIRNFLAENALKFVEQEVLDDLIDKLMSEVSEGLKNIGLDPLPIPDINIPYRLDKITEAVVPMIPGDQNSPVQQILQVVLQLCKGCSSKVAGELHLTNGILEGLSRIARQGPVVLTWEEEGAVRLGAKFGVQNLAAPFQSEASLESMKINPDIKTRIDNVGMDMDLQLPVSSGAKVQHNFDMNIGNVDVDLEGMGPLGDIAEFVAPYIADIVGSKLKEVMQTQVKDKLFDEVEKRIPNIKSILT